MSDLLHTELYDRIPFTGESIRSSLETRAGEVALASQGLSDPSISVVIRSRDNLSQLEGLFNDISQQQFDGEVEVVLVDTESTDGSVQFARENGATIVPVSQEGFSYPKTLNQGFEAAAHELVFSFVDHSALSSTQTLRTATRWNARPDVAGVFGTTIPNANGSISERLGSAVYHTAYFKQPASEAKPGLGFLATNCALIKKAAWLEAGGFDKAYGAGGEDSALGRSFLRVGHKVMQEPALSVFHSHGLNVVNSLRQAAYWMSVLKPREFSQRKLARYRPELR